MLWLLGALAVLAGIGTGAGAWIGLDPGAFGGAQRILAEVLLGATPDMVALAVAGVLGVGLVQSLLGAALHGGLIAIAGQALDGQPEDLAAALGAVRARFLSLFVIRLLIGASIIAPLLLVSGALLAVVALVAGGDVHPDARAALAGALCLLLPLFGVAVLAALLLSCIEALALRACLFEGAGALGAIRRGWRLLRARPLNVGLLWLAVTLIAWVGGSFLGGVIPAFTTAAVTALVTGAAPSAGALALFAAGYLLLLAAGGVLTAFESVLWTAGFRRIAAPLAGGNHS
jgi:hypothetical protein